MIIEYREAGLCSEQRTVGCTFCSGPAGHLSTVLKSSHPSLGTPAVA